MNDGFTGFDLVILIITLIIGYRIYSVLGRRTGKEKKPGTDDGQRAQGKSDGNARAKAIVENEIPLVTGLKKIKLQDKDFSLEHFRQGARAAFENILKGFVSGKISELKNLVSESIYKEFTSLVQEREKRKQTAELAFFRMVSDEVLESDLVGKEVRITVKFKSEQTLVIREGKKIIDGDPNVIDEVVDIWTFVRSIHSRSPNWTLESMDAEVPSQA